MKRSDNFVLPEAPQENYFRLLFMNSPLPMWVFQTKSRRILLANAAAVSLYGYSNEEFLQLRVEDLSPPASLLSLLKVSAQEHRPCRANGEKLHLKKDGSLIRVLETSQMLQPDQEKPECMVVIQDMAALAFETPLPLASPHPAQAILQHLDEVVFSFNESMEMVYVSPQCESLTGYTAQQFYQGQLLWYNLVHPLDRPLLEKIIKKQKKGKARFELEHRIRTACGEEKWVLTKGHVTVDIHGKLTRIDGCLQDVTDKKQNQERLQFANHSVESSTEPLIWVREDGCIMRANEAACTLLGYQEEELRTLRFLDISPSLEPLVWQAHWQAFEQLQSLTIETVLQGKNGQQHPVEIHWSHFFYQQEGYSFTSIREISERKKAESEKAFLTEKTVRQIEHLQQFAYIVSHNLSSPVANLVGLTHLYNRENPQDPNNTALIEKLVVTSQHLGSTINDLNEILTIRSKADQLLDVVDLQQGLLDARESLALQLVSCQAKITSDFSAGSMVIGVKSYVNSIFFNLISNAIKYRNPNRPLEIRVSTMICEKYLCLLVQDNGLGINLAKQRKKVFGLYRRFHPQIEGKGLGLYMAKTQAECMGGKIDIESAVDVGTTLKIFFKYQ